MTSASCQVAPVGKHETPKCSTNTEIFIDVETQKSESLLIQKDQCDELVTLLKLTCMAGSQPWAVFLLGPGKGYSTKPANRMGPLRVCLLQEEEGGSLPVQPDASRTRQGHTVDVSVTLCCLTVFL